jgi:hypothetical protein
MSLCKGDSLGGKLEVERESRRWRGWIWQSALCLCEKNTMKSTRTVIKYAGRWGGVQKG